MVTLTEAPGSTAKGTVIQNQRSGTSTSLNTLQRCRKSFSRDFARADQAVARFDFRQAAKLTAFPIGRPTVVIPHLVVAKPAFRINIGASVHLFLCQADVERFLCPIGLLHGVIARTTNRRLIQLPTSTTK